MKGKYDWNALKTEFVTSDISASALAKKHNINPQTLYRHYQIERWSEAKKEYLGSVMEKCADKAAYIAAIRLAKEIDIAGKLGDVLDDAASDKKQFCRYIVKDKDESGAVVTEERIFDKVDMQSLNNAIKALKSLEEIRRVMHGIASPAEEKRFALEEEKLRKSSEDESVKSGVVILPQIDDD
ncbi:MAG: hypothetical protein UIL37_04860 [Clostridia bacterium]|nr:hypothetical protein [Clostridia bacterium]